MFGRPKGPVECVGGWRSCFRLRLEGARPRGRRGCWSGGSGLCLRFVALRSQFLGVDLVCLGILVVDLCGAWPRGQRVVSSCIGFWPVFLINCPFLFFYINEKATLLPRFKKNKRLEADIVAIGLFVFSSFSSVPCVLVFFFFLPCFPSSLLYLSLILLMLLAG